MNPSPIPAGFTLVEILVVTVLVGIISLSMYAIFNNGMKIWQRVNQEMPEENVAIFFEKLTYDLRNTFNFSEIKFIGTKDGIRFTAIINSPGESIYSFDVNNGILNRQVRNYSQLYEDEQGSTQPLLLNVKFIAFQYYFYDVENKEYLWLDEWLKEGLPLAVNIELRLNKGAQNGGFTKTISIPAS